MISESLKQIPSFKNFEFLLSNDIYNFSIHKVEFNNSDITLIVTSGLKNFNQPVDEKNEAYKNIELCFCLPEYWDLKKKSWPIEWMNKLAEIPQKKNTWFGIGDTIPAGNPPVEIDPTFKADHFILSPPMLLADASFNMKNDSEEFKWLTIIPIFKKELDFKLQNSHRVLFQKFETKNVTELVDIYRAR